MVILYECPGLTHGTIRVLREVRQQVTDRRSLLHETFLQTGTPLRRFCRFHSVIRVGRPILPRRRLVWYFEARRRNGRTWFTDGCHRTAIPATLAATGENVIGTRTSFATRRSTRATICRYGARRKMKIGYGCRSGLPGVRLPLADIRNVARHRKVQRFTLSPGRRQDWPFGVRRPP